MATERPQNGQVKRDLISQDYIKSTRRLGHILASDLPSFECKCQIKGQVERPNSRTQQIKSSKNVPRQPITNDLYFQ